MRDAVILEKRINSNTESLIVCSDDICTEVRIYKAQEDDIHGERAIELSMEMTRRELEKFTARITEYLGNIKRETNAQR